MEISFHKNKITFKIPISTNEILNNFADVFKKNFVKKIKDNSFQKTIFEGKLYSNKKDFISAITSHYSKKFPEIASKFYALDDEIKMKHPILFQIKKISPLWFYSIQETFRNG